MAICMTRVDFRMVHGQVASVWIPHFSATKVVIVDDQTSTNDLVKQILTFAAPAGCQVVFYNVRDGVERYMKDRFGDGKIIVLFRSVKQAHEAYELGMDFESLNVGQTPREKGMVHATATVFLSKQDLDDLIEMQSKGVYVYFRQEISKPEVQLESVAKKLQGKF